MTEIFGVSLSKPRINRAGRAPETPLNQVHDHPAFRTAYVSGEDPQRVAAVAAMLRARGIEALTDAHIRPGRVISEEIVRVIGATDFAVLVLGHDSLEAVYSLGLARGMGRPVFVVTEDGISLPSDLRGVYIRALHEGASLEAIAPDLDRFIRNAKRPTPPTELPTAEGIDMSWARQRVERERETAFPARGQTFELLVQEVFEAAGGQVQTMNAGDEDLGVDMVVWLNDVAFEFGGPILVQCKALLGGGSGSVIKNAEAYARKLERALERSDAALALLVFDHSRPHTPTIPVATPDVVPFSIEDLIQGIESGTFAKEMARRRRRAAFLKGSAT